MCAISASYSVEKLRELYKLNAYRGVISSSVSVYDYDRQLVDLLRHKGEFGPSFWDTLADTYKNHYFVCHSQAPTNDSTEPTIHPAEYAGEDGTIRVYHNGIIKQESIDKWNAKLGTDYKWDTELLAHLMYRYGVGSPDLYLSDTKGAFALITHVESDAPRILICRNQIAPLFIDSDLNISSTKFDNSTSLTPDKLFMLDLRVGHVIHTGVTFKTLENPYWGL